MDWPSNLKLDHWYIGLIVVSTALLIFCLTANRNAEALMSLGGVVWGFGEWVNHPQKGGVMPARFNMPAYSITSTKRDPSLFGWLLDIAGLGLIALGAYRLVNF